LIPAAFETEPDEFGLYRLYFSVPSYIPDQETQLDEICDDNPGPAAHQRKKVQGVLTSLKDNIFEPFLNATIFRLMHWAYSGSNLLSITKIDQLVREVLLAKDYNPEDLQGFSTTQELKHLDDYNDKSPFPAEEGWNEASVKIRLPAERVKQRTEDEAPTFEVKGLFYRRITRVIKSAFQGENAKRFHLTPFHLFYQPSDNNATPERVFDELYTTDAFIIEHENIRMQPQEDGPKLETVVAACMLWSDSTHLANFGTAALWPVYMSFGNESKYTRGKPTSCSAYHIAYLPSVSLLDSFHVVLPYI